MVAAPYVCIHTHTDTHIHQYFGGYAWIIEPL